MRKPFHMTASLQLVSAIITALLRIGLPVGPAFLLSVRGRKSGKTYTLPIELVRTDEGSWLVAAFGEVSWVRNLRATGQAQLTRQRRTKAIRVIEVDAREAAPILKQYLRDSQGVSFIKPYFQVTPQSSLADFELEAAHHPVFRILDADQHAVRRDSQLFPKAS